jgi:pimeloyl-ACP methyl ester carboxylesterase
MTDAERKIWMKQRRENILKQRVMSRDALAAEIKEKAPYWSDREIGPWTLSKQQLSPLVVSGSLGKRRPWAEVAEAIQVPTLLITGNNDKGALVTPEIAQKAVQINDKIKVVYLDAEHSIRREVFDAYMEVVKAFLEKT